MERRFNPIITLWNFRVKEFEDMANYIHGVEQAAAKVEENYLEILTKIRKGEIKPEQLKVTPHGVDILEIPEKKRA